MIRQGLCHISGLPARAKANLYQLRSPCRTATPKQKAKLRYPSLEDACARGRSKNFLGTDSATTRTALVSTAIHAYALACIFDVSGAKNDAAIVRSSLGLRRLFAAVPFAALE